MAAVVRTAQCPAPATAESDGVSYANVDLCYSGADTVYCYTRHIEFYQE